MDSIRIDRPITHERLVYKPTEAAEVLGVSISTMYQFLRMESFPSFKCGKQWFVSIKGLDKWILEQAGVEV